MPEVAGFPSGEAAAHDALSGEKGFLTPGRLKKYDTERNNPTKHQVPSHPEYCALVCSMLQEHRPRGEACDTPQVQMNDPCCTAQWSNAFGSM